MIAGGRSLVLQIFGQTDRVGAKWRFSIYFSRTASAVTPSEKKFN